MIWSLPRGKTAPHLAVEAGNVKIVEILLTRQLTEEDINICDRSGKTPVFYAIENERWIIANVGFLIVFWSVVLL